MDFLNRAYAQLYDRYRSMTPGSRLTAGLLAIVVLLSLGYLFTHQTASPEVDLMHGVPLTAAELRTMEAALGKAKLQYEIRGSSILVPRGQEASCMAALSDGNALPKQCGEALSIALNSGGLWEDHRLTEQKTKFALLDVLAKAIGEMPGIEHASVLYDVDNKPGFNKEKVARAIAIVKSVGANPLSEAQVAAIRQAVGGGAVAGLKPENVTVFDQSVGRTWCPNAEDGSSGGEQNLYLAVQRAYEQVLRTKILNALCYIPNATVEVSVVLDRERSTRIRQDRRSSGDERSAGGGPVRGHGKAAPPERPAAVAQQQPNTAAALTALLGGGRSDEEPRDAEAADLGSHEHVEKESVGLTPLQARVSVGVPANYFENVCKKIWQERNPTEPGQPAPKPNAAALERIRNECSLMIRNHVATLLPLPESTAKAAESVTVSTFQPIPVQEPPPPDFNETLLTWLRQSWATLGMIALGLASLLLLRSMMRGSPPTANVQTMAVSAEPLDQLDADVADKIDENLESKIPRPHARRFDGAGSPLREELAELVATDPDAAASVLRNWIGPVE
jgi:flagellar M-ring protein FliF